MLNSTRLRLFVLVTIVSISGLSQGMLLPTVAVILENHGVPSTINGIHATGLYIGVLLASPFMEGPLRKFGFKPLIVVGGFITIIALFFFTITDSILLWFILRLFIGIGDQALHFSSQTWITSFSPPEKRGRNIALYGLSFGVGFAIGPMLTQLLAINEKLPFIIASIFSLIAWVTIFLLKNEFPAEAENSVQTYTIRSTMGNFGKVLKYAWAPLLPAICYGILEASLNGNFPVYGLRLGFDVHILSIIISSFAIGGIVFQMPLGMLSDKFGRRNMLLLCLSLGSVILFGAGLFEHSSKILLITMFFGGMLLGSTYSLSIAYLTDTIDRNLLPAGNLLISICYSLASIIGPFIGGLVIEYLPNISFFYFLSGMLIIIFIGLLSYRQKSVTQKMNKNYI